MRSIALLVLLTSVSLLPAQTTLSPEQIRGLPDLIMSIVEMQQEIAQLEQAVINQATRIADLEAQSGGLWWEQTYHLDQAQADFGLEKVPISPVAVYRGGARQTETMDYEINGSVIHFLGVVPKAGDVVSLHYEVVAPPAPVVTPSAWTGQLPETKAVMQGVRRRWTMRSINGQLISLPTKGDLQTYAQPN